MPRQQRAQQREKGRGGSVLCGCPPGNLDPRRAETAPVPVEENEGFSSARRGARRRGESWAYGVRRFGRRFTKSRGLEGLASSAWHTQAHILNPAGRNSILQICNMWPLSGSAAVEETAAAVISIDVPADYKWVLLALVGAQPA